MLYLCVCAFLLLLLWCVERAGHAGGRQHNKTKTPQINVVEKGLEGGKRVMISKRSKSEKKGSPPHYCGRSSLAHVSPKCEYKQ